MVGKVEHEFVVGVLHDPSQTNFLWRIRGIHGERVVQFQAALDRSYSWPRLQSSRRLPQL